MGDHKRKQGQAKAGGTGQARQPQQAHWQLAGQASLFKLKKRMKNRFTMRVPSEYGD